MTGFKPISIAILLLAGCIPSAVAQRGAGAAFGGHAGFGRGISSRFAGAHAPFSRNPYGRGLWWGDPFLYSDGDSTAYYPDEPSYRQEFAAPARELFGPPLQTQAEPLLIEWQGDRYARYSGDSGSQRAAASAQPDFIQAGRTPVANASLAAAPLAPAVLVYRDGHREDVPEYTIVGPTLYATGNYWQDGKWTKNVQISTLDLPATRQANQERGVNFILPSGPNVVVTRP